jgi:hypothetical protein
MRIVIISNMHLLLVYYREVRRKRLRQTTLLDPFYQFHDHLNSLIHISKIAIRINMLSPVRQYYSLYELESAAAAASLSL